MRTTLSIDDDILAVARERARMDGRAIGEVISDLARDGLQAARAARMGDAVSSARRFPQLPKRPGGVPVTLEIVNALRDEAP